MDEFRRLYRDDMLERFQATKGLADRALAQVADTDFFRQIDEESTSLAQMVKHVGGNLRSRFTDWLTTDGEKPDRHRDQEFVIGKADTREALSAAWEHGWACLFGSIEALEDEDLMRSIPIRSEPHSIPKALSRSLGHVSQHVGQIIYLARHLRGAEWQTLSIPKGQSQAFLEKMQSRWEKDAR